MPQKASMFPTKPKTKFSASNNTLSSIRFTRADPSSRERTQKEKWSLERTQTEKWSLEQIHIRLSAFIQTAVRSSELKFARANASEFHSEILQLSLFFFPLLHSFPQQPVIDLDLLSTPHSHHSHINNISNPLHQSINNKSIQHSIEMHKSYKQWNTMNLLK